MCVLIITFVDISNDTCEPFHKEYVIIQLSKNMKSYFDLM